MNTIANCPTGEAQSFHVEAGFSYETATRLMLDLCEKGFKVTGETLDGKKWVIDARKPAQGEQQDKQ